MEVLGGIVFFGALLILLALAIRGSANRPGKEPTVTIPLPYGELRVYVQHDGWAEWEKTVGGKVIKVEEIGIWDEDAIEVLVELGLPRDEARAQLAVVAEASKGVLSERGARLRDRAHPPGTARGSGLS